MTDYAEAIDITTRADLRRLARQVKQTGQAVPLTEDGEIVALVQPAPPGVETSASPGAAPIQAPQEFYADAVARPDVAEILRRLAQ